MGPALTETDSEHDSHSQAHRRALASVNRDSLMDEDDMGLQNHPNLAKDSQEMEQILVDLGGSDLAQADLLQAIKTLEGSGDVLSTGDPDNIFPLSGFELADSIDSEGDAAEEKIKLLQVRLERRCDFLQRRLRLLQARTIGKRVSEEAAQVFERTIKASRRDGAGRNLGLKAFLKRVETNATLQANSASKSLTGPKYFHAPKSSNDGSKSASVGVASGSLAGLEDTAGALRSHLAVVKQELDSDATLSSSGAESNDEAIAYTNPHQQPMPIEKRALWRWQRSRASIASRWCWLQAQIHELEYKVRQHNDLHTQVRAAKGPIQFEGEPTAYQGVLPGADVLDDPATETCARVRPLKRDTFKKRKLLQMHNLHTATDKAAKPSDINCGCTWGSESCAVCTGRAPAGTATSGTTSGATPAPPRQARASADPGYHPVLSDIADVSAAQHLSALVGCSWFRKRVSRARAPAPAPAPVPAPVPTAAHTPTPTLAAGKHKKDKDQPTARLKRGRPSMSRKEKRERERLREEKRAAKREEEENAHAPPAEMAAPVASSRPRGRGSGSSEARSSRPSAAYDIDNIVIPQSVAAATRPQILHYKEIVTPKWRVMDLQSKPVNNGVTKMEHHDFMSDSDDEDVSEAAFRERHNRSEARERSKYVRQQKSRRNTTTGDPVAAEQGTGAPPQTIVADVGHETVRPYSPREFPLQEATYSDMLASMPLGHRPMSPHVQDDDMSSLSPMSPSVFDCDDPDDIEWDPNKEKNDRRKSQAYR